MYENLLLLLMESKDQFNRIEPHIKEHTIGHDVRSLIETLKDYRNQHTGQDRVACEDLLSWYHTTRSARHSKDQNEVIEELIKGLKTAKLTETSDAVLEYYLKLDTVTKVANLSLEIGTGNSKHDIEDIQRILDDYEGSRKSTIDLQDLYTSSDLSDLIARVNSPGLAWRLEELNVGAGPLRPGDLALIAAAVESGKTTFLADQASYMATQLGPDDCIIWVNNEEHSDKVKLRVIQAALGITTKTILSDLNKARQDYEATMGGLDKIKIMRNQSAHNHVRFVERVVKEEKPALVVIDQLDKVRGFEGKDKAEHARIGHIYNWARDLAMDYDCAVMAASQVDTSGFNSKWIHMHQLRGSKVDKPGELDLLVTIGKITDDPNQDLIRYIHLPKNKLHGGPKSDERFRHGYFEVKINPPIARYEGVL